jgi:hypothetical protein
MAGAKSNVQSEAAAATEEKAFFTSISPYSTNEFLAASGRGAPCASRVQFIRG